MNTYMSAIVEATKLELGKLKKQLDTMPNSDMRISNINFHVVENRQTDECWVHGRVLLRGTVHGTGTKIKTNYPLGQS